MSGIGQRIREARKALNLSQANLAKLLGVDQSTVALWETDKTVPRNDKMEELAKILYLTPEFLHYGSQEKPKTSGKRNMIPVIGYVGAGNQIHGFPSRVIQETAAPPTGDDMPPATAAVVVRGQSMWPVYRDGDILYYNDSQRLKPTEAIGSECVVQILEGPQVVKRVMSGSKRGVYTLASYNAPEMRDIKIDWCAQIVWIRRNLDQPAD